MPQLQINQGPQDALLYDNTRSYFTNVGYTRTSNFQMELRDVDPQNTATLGSTVQFVLPKAADLLGPVDLCCEFTEPASTLDMAGGSSLGDGKSIWAGWVESLGFAMIDKIVFSVGSHDIETVTGDQLYIMNELMRADEHRFAKSHVLKTGRPLVRADCTKQQTTASYTVNGGISVNVNSTDITCDAFSGTLPVAGDKVYLGDVLVGVCEANSSATSLKLATVNIAIPDDALLTVRDTDSWDAIFDSSRKSDNSGRLIAAQYDDVDGADGDDHFTDGVAYDGKKLIVPLGLFFTKHPSQYFPLAAIAGCNDVRISVKFRSLQELLVIKSSQPVSGGVVGVGNATACTTIPAVQIASGECKLRCHYVHVTGPEASTLANREHVRLLKLWQNHNVTKNLTMDGKSQTLFDFELPFLHPVQELIIVIRKVSEMNSSTDCTAPPGDKDQRARSKNYFAFHGGGSDPNIESQAYGVHESGTSNAYSSWLDVENFQLTLNGQERHPSLAGKGIDKRYLMDRLMPMLHSNTSCTYCTVAEQSYGMATLSGSNATQSSVAALPSDIQALSEMLDRKEIYVYPFSLNPEGANPSGAVNFSKVSHAKLKITGTTSATVPPTNDEFRCDVWGVNFNWLQIKDGRALTSFA